MYYFSYVASYPSAADCTVVSSTRHSEAKSCVIGGRPTFYRNSTLTKPCLGSIFVMHQNFVIAMDVTVAYSPHLWHACHWNDAQIGGHHVAM